MKRITLALVYSTLSVLLCANVHADAPALSHSPNPDTRFTDALSAEDAAREAWLNTAPDGSKAQAGKKTDASTKANVNIFGSIVNNQGSPLCGLVLANGQFMFSCAPNGTYTLTVPQDGAGQVTLFGFAEGHFPFKSVFGGFGGRYDMTLNIASTIITPPPPPATTSTITFTITDGCNNGIYIQYKFYDTTNNLVWPSSTTHYNTTAYNASYTHNLSCRTGANVCYGGRSVNYYWGVDVDGSKSCTDCCISCQQGYTLSRRLTC